LSIYLNIVKCSWGKCKFCAYDNLGLKGIPTHDEMKDLIGGELQKMAKGQKYVKIFNGGSWFWDEVPVDLRNFVYDYLEEINVKNLRVENTFNLIHWDEIQSVIDRGFDLTISWGLEAADERILREVVKGVTLEKVGRMLDKASAMGVKNLLYLLAGLPYTTVDDFLHTVDWVMERKHQISELSTLTYVPIKGSEYYDTLWKTNKFRVISKEDWKTCREYLKRKTKNTGIGLTFETYHWRFLQGKTFEEVYNKDKRKGNLKYENVDGTS